MFKKFFNGVCGLVKKIGSSKEFEIAKFAFTSITACVDFHSALTDFIDQMRLVGATLAIIGKYILRGVFGFEDKARKAIA